MRKWVAWKLRCWSDRIYDTEHFCVVKFPGSSGLLVSCDAYGMGASSGVRLNWYDDEDLNPEWASIREFPVSEIDEALDWMGWHG